MLNIFALATLHMAVAPASAHGYVSRPPSRQALCRDALVPGCGDVKYEPQSVEAPKGSFKCNGDGVRFHELNEERLISVRMEGKGKFEFELNGKKFNLPSGMSSEGVEPPLPPRKSVEWFTTGLEFPMAE
ncbi:hypothetical protein C8R45DRAFT_928062 [Mycena sanguinolenta]|nr:hypothetical protein C8R45DRAFT_928062 [Mycena sanguinolenta]